MKYTEIDYEKIRNEAEENGIVLTDTEFLQVVHICTRKIETTGQASFYMNYLLPDELRHYVIRREVNRKTAKMLKEREEQHNGTDHRKTVFSKCGAESFVGA